MVSKNSNAKADFQIVILDEADAMTKDAQSALRRIIEDYTKTTRFCILCNYVSKIIPPITSRCAKFRFSPLNKTKQIERLKYIAQQEHINLNDNVFERIQSISEGDLRRSINLLQSISKIEPKYLDDDVFDDICGVIPNSLIQNIYSSTKNEKSPENLRKHIHQFASLGYDLQQVLVQFQELINDDQTIDDIKRGQLSKIILDKEILLISNATSEINYVDFFSKISDIFRK